MRIAVVSLAPLAHDARVLRHARALAMAGHNVTVIGEAPLPAAIDGVEVRSIGHRPSDNLERMSLLFRQAPANIHPMLAQPGYWLSSRRRLARALIEEARPEMVIANDWSALPLAAHAQRRFGARIIYDSHEMAIDEFNHSLKWRLAARAHVRAIEKQYIGLADRVITVSPRLADRLQQAYQLTEQPAVVRNWSDSPPAAFCPTGARRRFLYQGMLGPRRGLSALFDSFKDWPADTELIVRGPEASGFLARLQQHPACGTGRIRIEPPVPPDKTVAVAAAEADVGLWFLDGDLSQLSFALPNKILDYMLAGLGVIATDAPEVRSQLGAGGARFLPHVTAQAITEAVHAYSAAEIDHSKRANLAVAQSAYGANVNAFLDIVAQFA